MLWDLTTATYVLISIGVFGTLTVDEAIGYGETAIAEAARPSLGDAGFTLMAVAALIATAGATNGTLFGSAGLTASLAEIGQFPPLLGPRSRLGKHGGLLVTGSSPSSWRTSSTSPRSRRSEAPARSSSSCSSGSPATGCGRRRVRRAAIVLLGMAATVIVLGFFAVDTLRNAPETFAAIVAMTLLAVALDLVWKRRKASSTPAAPTPSMAPSGHWEARASKSSPARHR